MLSSAKDEKKLKTNHTVADRSQHLRMCYSSQRDDVRDILHYVGNISIVVIQCFQYISQCRVSVFSNDLFHMPFKTLVNHFATYWYQFLFLSVSFRYDGQSVICTGPLTPCDGCHGDHKILSVNCIPTKLGKHTHNYSYYLPYKYY